MNNKKNFFIITIVIAVIVSGIVYFNSRRSKVQIRANTLENGTDSVNISSDVSETVTDDSISMLFVYVCGEVMEPDVYELKEGSRICDAIRAAGGITDNANINRINQAAFIKDGDMICIPSRYTDDCNDLSGYAGSDNDNKLININTAGIEELTTLPGIGEARARTIIEYRENNGYFSTIEDIMKVSGIKNSAYEKIKEFICT